MAIDSALALALALALGLSLTHISLDLFLPSELIEIVKPTGLYPDDEIDKRIRDYLHEMDGIISTRERSVLA